MSRVDFYVIDAVGHESRQRFACRLAEKAYRLNHTVHIHVADQDSVRQLDALLWTFRDGSFVPHEILDAPAAEVPAPVTIGCDHIPSRQCDLLINLSDEFPDMADAFPRVAEIVTAEEDARARSRQRFVDYREQGHTLDTHKL
ncbi:MAG: DNA polymerase III subunit chi [Woeseiaceae bacterium]|nr:DNA polymerase III subunit chi [Woeseiaceae bacterium]